jgi:membrane protein YdbS with pleckstrin-like domain
MAADLGVIGRAPPRETLDPRTRTVWRLSGLVSSAVVLVIAGGAAALVLRWDGPPALAVLAVVIALLWLLAAVGIAPELEFRHWRYELGAEEIDLQHGMLTITRTLIPMARIQHVDTRRGLLQRRFGLASLVIYTAAGASSIPGLAAETADVLRDRIAALARTRDDL